MPKGGGWGPFGWYRVVGDLLERTETDRGRKRESEISYNRSNNKIL